MKKGGGGNVGTVAATGSPVTDLRTFGVVVWVNLTFKFEFTLSDFPAYQAIVIQQLSIG